MEKTQKSEGKLHVFFFFFFFFFLQAKWMIHKVQKTEHQKIS